MSARVKNIALAILSFVVTYIAAELLFSYCYVTGLINKPSRDGWYFEELGNTVHFDPVIGYKLTSTPSNTLRISNNEVEYTGIFKGNNQGFQDRDDFFPERHDPHALRIAIVGDSFSTEQFMAINWPDKVEDIARTNPQAPPLQLLNLSLYSGGLVNWRNIVTQVLDKEHYQVDALVFPVFANDLFRPFMIFEARDQTKLLIGNAGWDPDKLPATLEDAMPLLSPSEGHIFTHTQWQAFTRGEWHPELPRPWQAYMSASLKFLFQIARQKTGEWLSNPSEKFSLYQASRSMNQTLDTNSPATIDGSLSRGRFSVQHLRLIHDIKRYAEKNHLPVFVIRIPDKNEAVNQVPVAGNVAEFSEILGAQLLDGAGAFSNLTPAQKQALYFPYDGHWNQEGSDRFARYIYPEIMEAILRK